MEEEVLEKSKTLRAEGAEPDPERLKKWLEEVNPEDLGKLFLEGGGGGQLTESYELAMYFMARHTSIDCHEKRGKRGYLFIIGDEMPYPKVKRREVAQLGYAELVGRLFAFGAARVVFAASDAVRDA